MSRARIEAAAVIGTVAAAFGLALGGIFALGLTKMS